MLNGLDLFSGIGGLTLALRPWVRPVAYCEIDRVARAVLLTRMQSGDLPGAPIWDDVCSLTRSHLPLVDIVYGGFPCQDISVAGNGVGLAGERSGLFFEIARLVGEIRPPFVFLENVPAIRSRGADVVVGRLAELGYDCRWGVLSAFDVGAPHKRERWWLLAHGHGHGLEVESQRDREPEFRLTPQRADADGLCHPVPDADSCGVRDEEQRQARRRDDVQDVGRAEPFDNGSTESLADAEGERRREGRAECVLRAGQSVTAVGCEQVFDPRQWKSEPDVGRVAHGVPARVDRIRGLGNAVVPAQAREAFRRLMGLPTERPS